MRLITAIICAIVLSACGSPETKKNEAKTSATTQAVSNGGLASAASFKSISDDKVRSEALFSEMFKVISHPRCMNCHPRGDEPITQGDTMVPHSPMVSRGIDNFGEAGMKCSTCHGSENVAFTTGEGSIPGHDPWHVAPESMGWQGLGIGEICAQLKDKTRNGDKTLEELWEHNAKDGLVGWGWEPGEGRDPAPGSQKEFGDLTRAWIDSGAYCPA